MVQTDGQVLTTDGSTLHSQQYQVVVHHTVMLMFQHIYNGGWDFNLIPDANSTYDIGNASYKIRHIFLDDNLYIGNNTLNTSGSNLMFNSQDVQDWTNIKNKPTIPQMLRLNRYRKFTRWYNIYSRNRFTIKQ